MRAAGLTFFDPRFIRIQMPSIERIPAMVLLEFSMTPLGKGESVSSYVARCVSVIERSGLDYRLNSMGTVIEGELDEVLAVLKQCFDEIAADCDRISCSAKFDFRSGYQGRLDAKVKSVEQQVGHVLRK
jgi:uncharacterized protein (TIGR00106 family)